MSTRTVTCAICADSLPHDAPPLGFIRARRRQGATRARVGRVLKRQPAEHLPLPQARQLGRVEHEAVVERADVDHAGAALAVRHAGAYNGRRLQVDNGASGAGSAPRVNAFSRHASNLPSQGAACETPRTTVAGGRLAIQKWRAAKTVPKPNGRALTAIAPSFTLHSRLHTIVALRLVRRAMRLGLLAACCAALEADYTHRFETIKGVCRGTQGLSARLEVNSFDQCARLCDADPKCTAVDTDGRECYLKRGECSGRVGYCRRDWCSLRKVSGSAIPPAPSPPPSRPPAPLLSLASQRHIRHRSGAGRRFERRANSTRAHKGVNGQAFEAGAHELARTRVTMPG
jgi:hypothetical protein